MVWAGRHGAPHDIVARRRIDQRRGGGGGKGGTVAIHRTIFAKTWDFNRQAADLRIPTREGRRDQAWAEWRHQLFDGCDAGRLPLRITTAGEQGPGLGVQEGSPVLVITKTLTVIVEAIGVMIAAPQVVVAGLAVTLGPFAAFGRSGAVVFQVG